MPAKSKQQQKFFGIVKAMQDGDIPKEGEAGEVADNMTKKEVEKMASTKHKGLPKKVKEQFNINSFSDFVNEARLKGLKGSGSGLKSDIMKKWATTDDIMDDLRLFITAAKDAGGEDLVRDIFDSLRLMTNYAEGQLKESVNEATDFNQYSDEQLVGLHKFTKDPNHTAANAYVKAIEKELKKRKVKLDENEVSVNPGMNVPGMGHVVAPGDNGEAGSGDRMDLGSKKKKKSEEEEEEEAIIIGSSDESDKFSPKIANNKL